MGFLRRLFGGAQPTAAPDSDGWLLDPRADAVLDIVGEQSYQDALLKLGAPFNTEGPTIVDHLAVLVPEPDNRYDKNAIRVQIEQRRVGYLSRENALLYGPVVRWALEQGRYLVAHAKLTGGWNRGGGDRGIIGVKLHVGTPAETLIELLDDRMTIRSDHRWPGALVAFTGDNTCRISGMLLDRASSALLAQRAGMSVHPRVTKQVTLLVDCDITGASGNERKARGYGIEVVTEAEFWTELGIQLDVIDWAGARA
jgi:HIRAN domain-containing protein